MSSNEPTESIDDRKRRLTWQCRRGIKEVEVLLVPFFEKYFLDMSVEEQGDFETFLKEQDADMFEWFTMRVKPADPQIAKMVDVILSRMAPGL